MLLLFKSFGALCYVECAPWDDDNVFFSSLEYASGTTYFRESEAKLQYACMTKVFAWYVLWKFTKKKILGDYHCGLHPRPSSCAYKLLLAVLG
jgi:hypothetical protein